MSEKAVRIKQCYDVYLVGRASGDAKMEMAGDRPVVKFSMWVGSGKNKKLDKYQTPFYFRVKCWGDQAVDLRKGQDVEVFGYMTRYEFTDKEGKPQTIDEVVVKTNEAGDPMINYEGRPMTTKHVSDDAIAQGQGRTIQRKPSQEQSLEITDADIPF